MYRQIEVLGDLATLLFELSVPLPALLINLKVDVWSKRLVKGCNALGVLLYYVPNAHKMTIVTEPALMRGFDGRLVLACRPLLKPLSLGFERLAVSEVSTSTNRC